MNHRRYVPPADHLQSNRDAGKGVGPDSSGERGRTKYWRDPASEVEKEEPTGDQEEEIGAGMAYVTEPLEESRYPAESDMPVGEPVPDEPPPLAGGDTNFSC
jgi:hypothetical protein